MAIATAVYQNIDRAEQKKKKNSWHRDSIRTKKKEERTCTHAFTRQNNERRVFFF